MIDHANTIRRTIDRSYPPNRAQAYEALDALVAERQQAIDALREIADFTVYASDAPTHAAEALANLGEQP